MKNLSLNINKPLNIVFLTSLLLILFNLGACTRNNMPYGGAAVPKDGPEYTEKININTATTNK